MGDTLRLMNIIRIISSWMLIASPLLSDVLPSFTKPSSSDQGTSCHENINLNTSIYEVKLASPPGYNVTIQIQMPPNPQFQLIKGLYNWNLMTPVNASIDRENTSQFTFVFYATDGTQSERSVPLTLDIEDENDNIPQFTNDPYTGTIYNTAQAGNFSLTIQATDEDLNPNITYSIAGGDGGNMFSLDQYTGLLKLKTPGNLNPATTPKYTLTVQASDGKNINTTNVNIHVLVDPCYSNPCQNGGMCAVNGTTFTCSCTSGFNGSNCNVTGSSTSASYVSGDPCISKPCSNGGTCMVVGTSFSCPCVSGLTGNTCSTMVTTDGSQTETPDQGSKTDSSSKLLAVYIVVPMLIVGIVVAAIFFYKYKTRQKKVDANLQVDPSNQRYEPPNRTADHTPAPPNNSVIEVDETNSCAEMKLGDNQNSNE